MFDTIEPMNRNISKLTFNSRLAVPRQVPKNVSLLPIRQGNVGLQSAIEEHV